MMVVPWRSVVTRSAFFRTEKWPDNVALAIGKCSAISPALNAFFRNNLRMSRRTGCARASKTLFIFCYLGNYRNNVNTPLFCRLQFRVTGGGYNAVMSLPNLLNTSINRQVLQWLKDQSAHDDVSTALTSATKPLGDVQLYCPDPKQYRFVLAATANVAFAAATGMSEVAFRLNSVMRERALRSGADTNVAAGEEWVQFTLFRNDWPEPDLRFWALKAYVHAREIAVRGR